MPRRGIDLTEEQWRLAKANAASRGQTLSQYFGELLQVDLGKDMNHRISEAITPAPVIKAILPPPAKDEPKLTIQDASVGPYRLVDEPYREFRPVPKPSQKGKHK